MLQKKEGLSLCIILILCIMISLSGCSQKCANIESHRPRLFLSLPDSCNTPDGMTTAPNGDIILACPNFNDVKYPGILMKIDAQNNLSRFYEMPVHSQTGRGGPMGLDFGPDGNLYVADNQYFYDTDYKSRLIRVNIKNGVPISSDVVIDGFKLANAVIWKDNYVYVSDTFFDLQDKPGASGIYKFSLDEIKNGPILLKPNAADEHLIADFITEPNKRNDLAGADGLTFDSRGNLYTGMFGNGDFYKLTFNKDGRLKSKELLVKEPELPCVDGIFYDPKSDLIYVTDSQNNAIHTINPKGRRKTLWQNKDTDGSDGLLDQPCEPLIRGKELILVNFDMPFPGLKNSAYDQQHTISVIKLECNE